MQSYCRPHSYVPPSLDDDTILHCGLSNNVVYNMDRESAPTLLSPFAVPFNIPKTPHDNVDGSSRIPCCNP